MTADKACQIRVWRSPPPIHVPPDAAPPKVQMNEGSLLQLIAQSRCTCEVGGLLFGGVDFDDGFLTVNVTDWLAADAVDNGPAHITFTHESWKRLRARRLREYPNSLLVGWYHTHPGSGVFFSGLDRALHQEIFGEWIWSVALVIDPLRDRRAFFWNGPSGLCQCQESTSGH